MELIALLLCLLAVPVMTFLRSYNRRARAEATVHFVSDPGVAHRALIENADDLSSRPAAIFPVFLASLRDGRRNDNMTTASYGPHWRALLCNLASGSILHPSRLASLAPLLQEAAEALVGGLHARAERAAGLRVRGPVTAAAFALSTRLCFGDSVDDAHRRAMGRVTRDSMLAIGELSPRFDGSMLSKLVNWRALRRISALLDRQADLYRPLIAAAAARKQSHSRLCGGGVFQPYVDSLLDLRVPADDGDARRALRETELDGLLFEFLGAGTGSVVTCVEWAIAHLIDQPEVQDKLRREINEDGVLSSKSLRTGMPYLNAVVLDSLRMHPPVPLILRAAHGEGTKAIGAATVPASGLRVMFNLGHIGRDKKMWADPDEFRPERFLTGGEAEDVGPTPGSKEIRMMPFGAGNRHCPGVGMGMMLIKCFLAALVREFEWAPDCSGRVDMTELDGFLKMMKKPLSANVTQHT